MATSVIIESTNASGEKGQKTITYVNPNASNGEISAFAKALNGLTTNTEPTVFRVDKTDITDAVIKQSRNIEFNFVFHPDGGSPHYITSVSKTDLADTTICKSLVLDNLDQEGSNAVSVAVDNYGIGFQVIGNVTYFGIVENADFGSPSSLNFTVNVAETEHYKQQTFTATIAVTY